MYYHTAQMVSFFFCHSLSQYIQSNCLPTIGEKPTGNSCTQRKSRGFCRYLDSSPFNFLPCSFVGWLVDWFFFFFIKFTDWSFLIWVDSLVDWLTSWMMDQLTAWLEMIDGYVYMWMIQCLMYFRGLLHDTVLDWEACLPEHDLGRAEEFSRWNLKNAYLA